MIKKKITALNRIKSKLDKDEYRSLHQPLYRERALWDPYWFIESIIGYPDLHEPLHRPMIEGVCWGPGREKLEMYPRGTFKTSVESIGYPTWRIVRDNNIRIQINNAVVPLAIEIAETIQKQFRVAKETGPLNVRMAYLFPEFMLPAVKHAASNFVSPARDVLWIKEPTVEASGVGSEQTGNHYDLIINDDLVTKKCIKSQATNQEVKDFYAGQAPILDPPKDPEWKEQTARLTIGTHYSESDLYCDMKANEGDMMDEDFVCRTLGLKYRRKDKSFNKKRKVGEYIFPTRWDKKRERSEKARMMKVPGGEFLFYSQYYNETRNRSNIRFDKSMFERVNLNDSRLYNLNRWRQYLIVDPSASKQYYSDPTAMVDLRVSPQNLWLVAGIVNKAMNPDELVELLYRIAARENGTSPRIHEIIFELRGLQATYKTAIEYYGRLPRSEHLNGLTLPPIVTPLRKNTHSKEEYIDQLLSMYRVGQILHLEGIDNLDVYENQLLAHRNNPKHDDIMDCVAMAPGKVNPPFGDYSETEQPEEFEIAHMTMNDVRSIQKQMMQKRMRNGLHGPGVPLSQGVA